jgi:biopolymer transport protein TolR
MQLGGGGGVKSDINVTPLVDVMLVLLIIMMIVAPLIQQGASVTLPKARNTSEKPETSGQTVLAITTDRRLWLNAIQVPAGSLAGRLREIQDEGGDSVVILKADENVPYSAVMDAMDELRAAGIEDIGLITDPRASADEEGGE